MILEPPSGWLLISARACGFILMLPSVEGVSSLSRLLIGVCLGTGISYTVGIGGNVSCSWQNVGSEFVTGLLLSVPVVLLLESLVSVGEYFDAMRGQLLGNIQDPISMSLQSTSAVAARVGGIALVLSCGGLEVLASSFVSSYTLIPAGSLATLSMPLERSEIFQAAHAAIVMPLAILTLLGSLCLLVELVAAAAARLTNGVYVSELQFACKSMFGCVVILLLLRYLADSDRVASMIRSSLLIH